LDLAVDLRFGAGLLRCPRTGLRRLADARALDFLPILDLLAGVLAAIFGVSAAAAAAAWASTLSMCRATSATGAMPSTECCTPWRR
jgi:hypothetical protein